MKNNFFIALLLVFSFNACAPKLTLTNKQGQNIKINNDSLKLRDETTFNIIAPYKVKIDSLMNEVLCYNESELKKDLPEGTLGNFVCDELMDFARAEYKKPIDFCIYNNGGLRVQSIGKGNITTGKIFELAPFENALVVVELLGKDCKELIEIIARNNGTPCSKELRFSIQNQSPINITINNKLFDENQHYFILTNDYVANGGDKSEPMKRALSTATLNLMVRDALIKQLRKRKIQTINTVLDGRIQQTK